MDSNCNKNFEPIHRPISNNDVVKELLFHGGNEILLDPNLLRYIASRLDIKQQKLLKLVRIAINKDIPRKLLEIKQISEIGQISMLYSIIRKLIAETSINVEDAKEIVAYFADPLGIDINMIPENYTYNDIIPEPQSLSNDCDSSLIKTGDTFTFGDCEWLVLDVKKYRALLLLKHIFIMSLEYSKTVNITWERSITRKYLNRTFIRRFTIEEQSRIIETKNINNGNQWYCSKVGRDTKDKIFLLGFEEVDKYFGDSGDFQYGWREKYENDQPIIQNKGYYFSNTHDKKRIALYNNKEYSWQLRSPGGDNSPAAIVDDDGRIFINDHNHYKIAKGGGLRPALWIKL